MYTNTQPQKKVPVLPLRVRLTQLTFISDLFGGATLASSTLISPSGILFSAWCMILRDCLISSTRHKYLQRTHTHTT